MTIRLVSLALLIAAWFVGAQFAGPRMLPIRRPSRVMMVDEARTGALALNLARR